MKSFALNSRLAQKLRFVNLSHYYHMNQFYLVIRSGKLLNLNASNSQIKFAGTIVNGEAGSAFLEVNRPLALNEKNNMTFPFQSLSTNVPKESVYSSTKPENRIIVRE